MPAWPSMVSLPSPGFQTKVSSPAPRKRDVVPLAAVDEVAAGGADEQVAVVAAVRLEVDRGRGEPGRVDDVVARRAR